MTWIIVGGAPLSRETHEFIRVCLGAIVVQVQKNIAGGYPPRQNIRVTTNVAVSSTR